MDDTVLRFTELSSISFQKIWWNWKMDSYNLFKDFIVKKVSYFE